MVHFFNPEKMLELGTCLGIGSAYMAMARQGGELTTLEGCPNLSKLAEENFKKLHLQNIKIVQGNFDETLDGGGATFEKVDFAFVDGNHQKEPTLNYFQKLLSKAIDGTVFVFDDIHWSEEMESTWEEIKSHERVKISMDFFRFGVVVFREGQKEQQHYTLKY